MSKPFDYNKFVAEQPDSMISKIVLRDEATYDKQGVTFTDLQRRQDRKRNLYDKHMSFV